MSSVQIGLVVAAVAGGSAYMVVVLCRNAPHLTRAEVAGIARWAVAAVAAGTAAGWLLPDPLAAWVATRLSVVLVAVVSVALWRSANSWRK